MKEKKIGNVLVRLMYFTVSVCGGILLGLSISYAPGTMESLPMLIGFYLFCIASASIIQIIVHEGGHLIFGLLSGYRFSSFRIGSLALVKISGKCHLRRYSLSGTAGQCLMLPPKEGWENMKVFAYNMGGAFLNIITALALFAASGHIEGLLSDWLGSIGTMGLIYAALNGIPLRGEQLSNDGANMLGLLRDPQLKKCFWVQLSVNGALAEGTRISELPAEWFELPEGADPSSPMCSGIRIMGIQRLVDQGMYETAAFQMENILRENTLQSLYANMVKLDLLTLRLISPAGTADCGILGEKDMKRFVSSMGRSTFVLRTLYCCALHDSDTKKAAALKKRFEKAADNYPYQGELCIDRALMEEAERKYVL